MFKNRFADCKSIEDLRNVMTNSKLTFRVLSKEEVESINSLLATAIPNHSEVRINDDSDFNKLQKALNNKNEEETTMPEVKVTLKETITNNDGSINKEAIANFIDETAKEIADASNGCNADDNINTEKVKARLVGITELLGIIGLSKLKSDIERVIYAGLNEKGNLSPDSMMETIIGLCQEERKRLEYWSTDKTVIQSFALKAITSEDGYGNKNIFQAANSALLNIVKRVTNFVTSQYDMLENKAKGVVIKGILKGFRELFGALIEGVKFAVELVGCSIALVLCTVTAIGYWAFNTIKKLFIRLHKYFKEKGCDKETSTEEIVNAVVEDTAVEN
jgi:hypothetical protein